MESFEHETKQLKEQITNLLLELDPYGIMDELKENEEPCDSVMHYLDVLSMENQGGIVKLLIDVTRDYPDEKISHEAYDLLMKIKDSASSEFFRSKGDLLDLLPKELEEEIPPLFSTEDVPFSEKTVSAILHHPLTDWSWLVTEYDPKSKEAFGFVKGFEEEWGSFFIPELEQICVYREEEFTPQKFSNLDLQNDMYSRSSKRIVEVALSMEHEYEL